ncbi:surface-adhesin E family protein [Geobacter sp. SVR]|uniref:surface-adhesin E family protein n=1 Tax=Geobacter sp. SVR TaxID=2495594 RepID=UPI00143F0373|nr:surface-adhesin E family protein [Geobacter sp. SVR]BCS52583.1 hypothetical protein GSVR_08910 [Geobacter sp. SVR]GCF83979.1 hypothetical protein GSbR_05790 [Geobacter sp. SVR]
MNILKGIAGGALLLVAAQAVPVDAPAGSRPQWQVLFGDKDSQNSYDKANVKKNGNIITVTTRIAYTAKGKADALELLKYPQGFDDLAYTIYVHDTNCSDMINKLRTVTHYNSKGAEIRNVDMSGVAEWEKIQPDSLMEMVANAECPR